MMKKEIRIFRVGTEQLFLNCSVLYVVLICALRMIINTIVNKIKVCYSFKCQKN
jgi:hypothetical protein